MRRSWRVFFNKKLIHFFFSTLLTAVVQNPGQQGQGMPVGVTFAMTSCSVSASTWGLADARCAESA